MKTLILSLLAISSSLFFIASAKANDCESSMESTEISTSQTIQFGKFVLNLGTLSAGDLIIVQRREPFAGYIGLFRGTRSKENLAPTLEFYIIDFDLIKRNELSISLDNLALRSQRDTWDRNYTVIEKIDIDKEALYPERQKLLQKVVSEVQSNSLQEETLKSFSSLINPSISYPDIQVKLVD